MTKICLALSVFNFIYHGRKKMVQGGLFKLNETRIPFLFKGKYDLKTRQFTHTKNKNIVTILVTKVYVIFFYLNFDMRFIMNNAVP